MKKQTIFLSLIDAETKTPLSVVSTYKTILDIVANNGATCSIFEADGFFCGGEQLKIIPMLKVILHDASKCILDSIIDTIDVAIDPDNVILQTETSIAEIK